MEWTDGVTPDPALAGEITIERVRAAAGVVSPLVHRTPIVTSRTLDDLVGARAVLKCENLQRVGAFKVRGAINALSRFTAQQRARGVITYSSGNHAQGMALAAATLGVPAVIVMPTNAPPVKLAATRGYLRRAPEGSEVMLYDPDETKREELGRKIAGERGLTLIPPYDHPDVICGQGTAALELFEDAGDLDRLYVPLGGGGLLSGCATVARGVCPACEVIGVEPEAGDDGKRSFESGRLVSVRNPDTIADGARTPYLGRYTFSVIRDRVDRVETVADGELAKLVVFALERLKLVIEPSGVLGLARLAREARERPDAFRGQRVGVMISGGNLDLAMIDRARAMANDGR